MKKTFLFLFLGVSLIADHYEPCPKTYVEPALVQLIENRIYVRENNEVIQTSAVYSDDWGLFFIDKMIRTPLPPVHDFSSLQESTSEGLHTDRQLDESQGIYPSESHPITTDAHHINRSRGKNWPFCDKER